MSKLITFLFQRPVESILDEVKELVDKGYKEITLLGQNIVSTNASVPLFA